MIIAADENMWSVTDIQAQRHDHVSDEVITHPTTQKYVLVIHAYAYIYIYICTYIYICMYVYAALYMLDFERLDCFRRVLEAQKA